MDAPLPLAPEFLKELPSSFVAPPVAKLEPVLASALERVRQRFPGAEPVPFLCALARGLKADRDVLEAIPSLFVEDLWLAQAAVSGDRAAVGELDRVLEQAVRTALSRMRVDASFRDEVAQRLRGKLLVAGEGIRPKLFDYAGRGALSRWLEAAALRIALNLKEGEKGDREVGESALADAEAPGHHPDAALMRGRYGPELKSALEEVLSGLPVRERNLLRLYFVQGLTVEEIGRIEGTHKSTVSRWLARVRTGVLEQLRAVLARRLGLPPGEVDSVVAEVRSQLHLSVSRVLGPRGA